jgi:hypothetical protein
MFLLSGPLTTPPRCWETRGLFPVHGFFPSASYFLRSSGLSG